MVGSDAGGAPSWKYSPTTLEDSCRPESAEEVAEPGSDGMPLSKSPEIVKWARRIVFRSAERFQVRSSTAVAMLDARVGVDVDVAR